MSTPHNNAKKGDIAKTVLMPGDPLRARFIAENYLDSPVCYNEVRGMLGFTGTYKGVPVSVQGSGMGMPSIGIYSWELFNEYEVENIIRVGTAGAVSDSVALRDVIIGISASTNSNYTSQYRLPGTYAPTASWQLISAAVKAARPKAAPTTSATSSQAILSMTTPTALQNGRKWAFSVLKWKLPHST